MFQVAYTWRQTFSPVGTTCERVEVAPTGGGSNMGSVRQGGSGSLCLQSEYLLPLFFSMTDRDAPLACPMFSAGATDLHRPNSECASM